VADEIVVSFHRSTNGSVTRSRCNNSAKLHSSSEKRLRNAAVVEAALKAAGIQMKHTRIIMELIPLSDQVRSRSRFGSRVCLRRAIQKEVKLDTLREAHIANFGIQRTFAIIYPRGPELRGAAGVFLRFLREKRDRGK